MALKVDCPCGTTVRGDNEDEFVVNVQEHVRDKHPEMADGMTRVKILEMVFRGVRSRRARRQRRRVWETPARHREDPAEVSSEDSSPGVATRVSTVSRRASSIASGAPTPLRSHEALEVARGVHGHAVEPNQTRSPGRMPEASAAEPAMTSTTSTPESCV